MNGYNTNKLDECVIVPHANRSDFWLWCQENKIDCQYEGRLNPINDSLRTLSPELWYIKDIKHRIWAKLRWS